MAGINTVEFGAVEWNAGFIVPGLDADISAAATAGAVFSAQAASFGLLLATAGAADTQDTDAANYVLLAALADADEVMSALAAASAALTAAATASETQLGSDAIVAAISGQANAAATMAALATAVATIQEAVAAGETWAIDLQALAAMLAPATAAETVTSLAAAFASLAADAVAAATFADTAALAVTAALTASASAHAALTAVMHVYDEFDDAYVDAGEVLDGEVFAAPVFADLAAQALAGMATEADLTATQVTFLAGATAGSIFSPHARFGRTFIGASIATDLFSIPAEVRMLVATIALFSRISGSVALHTVTDLTTVSARYRVIEEE